MRRIAVLTFLLLALFGLAVGWFDYMPEALRLAASGCVGIGIGAVIVESLS